jgi:hypothetical protein
VQEVTRWVAGREGFSEHIHLGHERLYGPQVVVVRRFNRLEEKEAESVT